MALNLLVTEGLVHDLQWGTLAGGTHDHHLGFLGQDDPCFYPPPSLVLHRLPPSKTALKARSAKLLAA
jgi:hypothetical protein